MCLHENYEMESLTSDFLGVIQQTPDSPVAISPNQLTVGYVRDSFEQTHHNVRALPCCTIMIRGFPKLDYIYQEYAKTMKV